MSGKAKYARESYTTMTEMVLLNDTNTLNNLMGGRLMYFMDMVSAIAALKHCNRVVVTASVDNISFKRAYSTWKCSYFASQSYKGFQFVYRSAYRSFC